MADWSKLERTNGDRKYDRAQDSQKAHYNIVRTAKNSHSAGGDQSPGARREGNSELLTTNAADESSGSSGMRRVQRPAPVLVICSTK